MKHICYGGGLTIDTNLARNEVFDYRLEIGFSNLQVSNKFESWTLLIPISGTYIPYGGKQTRL